MQGKEVDDNSSLASFIPLVKNTDMEWKTTEWLAYFIYRFGGYFWRFKFWDLSFNVLKSSLFFLQSTHWVIKDRHGLKIQNDLHISFTILSVL